MADGTKIEWSDATWNILTGCSIVSPGCSSCYAMKLAGGRLQHHPSRAGLTKPSKAGPIWTGEVRYNRDWLTQPIKWTKPRQIFVCAHGDLFADGVETRWLDEIFGVMALCPQHTFQVLTKRPQRAAEYLSGIGRSAHPQNMARRAIESVLKPGSKHKMPPWPLPNVWVGTSVEDQPRAAERLVHLRNVQAAVRWVSFEPLLGHVDARNIELPHERFDALTGERHFADGRVMNSGPIHWAVIGGESGPGARPMHPDWARSLRDQCQTAGVPYFFKQWGGWARWKPALSADVTYLGADGSRSTNPGIGREPMTLVGKKVAGRLLDGVEWNQMPTGASS